MPVRKRVLTCILSAVLLLTVTGCSSADYKPAQQGTTSANVGSFGVSEASSSTQTTELSPISESSTNNEDDSLQSELLSYESLVAPVGDTAACINIAGIAQLELPEQLASRLVPIDEMQEKMSAYVTEHTKSDEMTPDIWRSAFQNLAYMVKYPDVCLLMSEDVIMQINVYAYSDSVPDLYTALADSTDGVVFNGLFGEMLQSCCYKTEKFGVIQSAGEIDDGDIHIASYIFAAEAVDFVTTDSYFGYLIFGYNSKGYFTALIAGLNNITQPELIQEIYTSFDSVNADAEYWCTLDIYE